jgi:ketosteroid isomerase-like protein
MRNWICGLFVILAGCTFNPTPIRSSDASIADAKTQIARVLDDWHDAASKSDEERYFGYFADNAIFLGTDATERWDVKAFRAYAHPYFSQGKGWAFHAIHRNITVGESGYAWFDEALETKNLGPARGSGVLIKSPEGMWKIAQYNLAITIPNERFTEVRKLLEEPPASTSK